MKLTRPTKNRPPLHDPEERQPTCYDARDPIRPWLAAEPDPDDFEDRAFTRTWADTHDMNAHSEPQGFTEVEFTRTPGRPPHTLRRLSTERRPFAWMRYRVTGADVPGKRIEIVLLPDDGLLIGMLDTDKGMVRLFAGQRTWISTDTYAFLRRDPQFAKVDG